MEELVFLGVGGFAVLVMFTIWLRARDRFWKARIEEERKFRELADKLRQK